MMDMVDFFEAHDRKQQKRVRRLPVCDYCNEPIQEDSFFEINDEFICEDCLEKFFRKVVDDYLG